MSFENSLDNDINMIDCVEEKCDIEMEVDDDQARSPEKIIPLKYEVETVLDGEVILSSPQELKTCEKDDLVHIDIQVKSEEFEQINFSRQSLLNDSEKPIFVSFRNAKNVRFYWRARKSDKFYSLNISEASDGTITSFCKEFLISEVINKRNGILQGSNGKSVINIRDIGNSQRCDLLRIAVMRNNFNLVKNLLQFNFNVDRKNDDGSIAIDSAWSIYCNSIHDNEKKKSSSIMMILLEAGSRNPIKIKDISKEFIYKEAPEEVKYFLDNNEQWHDYVDENDLKSLDNLFTENSNYNRHCYNRHNQSLMMTALISGNDEIQEFLSARGCIIGIHEIDEFKSLMKNNETKMNRHIKRVKLNAHTNPLMHVYILEACSIIVNSVPNFKKYWMSIQKALRALNKDDDCSLILQLAATVKNLTIEWDFELDTVCYMIPTRSVYSVGCCDGNGTIYLAGKELLNEDKKYEVYGHIIHEFCHVALNVTYMNVFLPYPIGESSQKKYFREKVVKECEDHQKDETLIEIAFEEDDVNKFEYTRDCELIVRPIHIKMQYKFNLHKFNFCKKKFSYLFNLFFDSILNDMGETLKLMSKLNDKEALVKYEDLTNPMKIKIYHTKVRLNGVENTFKEIIGNFDEFENIIKACGLSPDSIKNCLLNNKIFQFTESNNNTKEHEYEVINRKFILKLQNEENIDENVQVISKNLDEIIEFVKISKVFILADESGAGKTVTLKHIKQYLDEKKYFTDHWISFITLKNNEEYFMKFINKDHNALSILRTIQNINPGIESEIFNNMFENGKVILFFDGYDEICPKVDTFFIKFLKEIKEKMIKINENGEKIENQIWISTRLQHKKELEKALKTKAFMHEPLSREDIENLFIQTYNKHKKNDQKDKQIILKEFNNFYEFINTDKYGQKWSDSFDLNNPLLITIIAELHANNKIELNSESLNLYNIFEKITENVRKFHDSKVNVNDKDPTITHFTLGHVHQVLALTYLYHEDLIENLSIIKLWKLEKSKWKVSKIQRFGFVDLDAEFDENPIGKYIHFKHRSYAEYFLAEFIVSFFTCGLKIDDEDLNIIFNKITIGIDSGIIFKFILTSMLNNPNRKIKSHEKLNKLEELLIKTKNDFENDKENDHFTKFQSSLNNYYLIKDELIFKLLCIFLLNNRDILENFFLSKKNENFLEFVLLKGESTESSDNEEMPSTSRQNQASNYDPKAQARLQAYLDNESSDDE
ncbi:uncharacterized protein [Chironomus tepperi]|uniref:uncharacterized protein n=1 Tax=Chironomus tepperi TaxID=113505 RepID=UPI00391FB84C